MNNSFFLFLVFAADDIIIQKNSAEIPMVNRTVFCFYISG